jgi:hypothetical protein
MGPKLVIFFTGDHPGIILLISKSPEKVKLNSLN